MVRSRGTVFYVSNAKPSKISRSNPQSKQGIGATLIAVRPFISLER
jgi:hypothetical protein